MLAAALALTGAPAHAFRVRNRKGRRSPTACGMKGPSADVSSQPGASIVNGQNATECEWRWQVGLTSNPDRQPWCGGMLIHPEWVLTAAHCASEPDFNVVVGEHITDTHTGREQNHWAVQVIQHPQYASSPTRWDFALVRVSHPFELNDCVGTVCLPAHGADVLPGTACTITGWGKTAEGGFSAGVLQEAEVTVLSNEDCAATGYNASDIRPNMLCAQGRTSDGRITDACNGDSGGPLVCETSGVWTAYGATSWGEGCAGAEYPGIWARVHEAIDWIDETLDANSGPAPTLDMLACPSFARNRFPDKDGDCVCPPGMGCSTNGGANWNCPTSGGLGWAGAFFQPNCTEACACYRP